MVRSFLSRRDLLKWAGGMTLALSGLRLATGGSAKSAHSLTEFTGLTMGTTYSVKVTDLPGSVDPVALRAALQRILHTVNAQMSTYQADSELSRLNASPSTDWIEVSSDTLVVIDAALRVSRLCAGAFDVTVGPLVNLWGFGPSVRGAVLPTDGQIRAALARVGYTGLQTRQWPPAVKKDRPDIYIDLSAIAKGYGIDRLAEHLDALHITDYLIEIGGELRGRGHNARGEPWKIAIEKPLVGRTAVQRVVHLHDGVLATSGNYRNYFEVQGRRYPHIIHPRTGEPIAHTLAAVTLIGQSTMQADALTTAFMVLGPEVGFALAQRENLAALFLVGDGRDVVELSTPAFEPYAVRS